MQAQLLGYWVFRGEKGASGAKKGKRTCASLERPYTFPGGRRGEEGRPPEKGAVADSIDQ